MGIIEALELRSMQSKEGIGLEFIFIICAVVGGCLLTGGYGSVIGTFFGAAMLGMVQLGIVDSQWDSNWTYTFQGAILFAAVLLNTVIRNRAQKSRDERCTHLLEVDSISKYYGNVVALKDISAHVNAGEVTCILGDNGAGKSSFIKILSGVHRHDEGRLLVDGEEVHFSSPRDARANGIATVYQDLAMVPLMSVWRNFFLGAEPPQALGPLQWLDAATAKEIVRTELQRDGDRHPRSRPAGRARSRAASGSRSRSPGPSTSAPAC